MTVNVQGASFLVCSAHRLVSKPYNLFCGVFDFFCSYALQIRRELPIRLDFSNLQHLENEINKTCNTTKLKIKWVEREKNYPFEVRFGNKSYGN